MQPAGRAEIPALMRQRMHVGRHRLSKDPLLPVYSHVDAPVRGAGLIERVRTVKFAAGDIEAARAALNRLVEGGNEWAAVDLGSTYDPIILDALGVRNFPADVAKARTWYQMAQQMGSPEAVELLESLERSERRSP